MKQTLGLASLLILAFLVRSPIFANPILKQSGDNAPLGVWLWSKVDYKDTINVKITREKDHWSVRVDDEPVIPIKTKQQISFLLPNGQSFSGALVSNNTIAGTWFQPNAEIGSYMKMATLVNFKSSAENEWQGNVHLQPRPYHLFLDIFEDKNGDVKAAIRNPQTNDMLGSRIFDVQYLGDEGKVQNWQLLAKRRNQEIAIPLIYADNQTITLEHTRVPKTAIFYKAKKSELEKYYSRTPSDQAIEHQSVTQLNDGWNVANAVDAGFDGKILNKLVDKLVNTDPRARAPQLLHSLLVSYKGQLVIEEYFYGHKSSDVHDTRSLGKVFGSMLVGAAQQQGFKIDASYLPLPEIFKQNGLDLPSNKSGINLGHFLTHTSGLDASENQQSLGSEERLMALQNEDLWLYTAKLPVLHPPGKRFAYASASANMVGASIEQVTKESVHAFFHKSIAKPLGFSPYHWNLTSNDKPYLGGGVYMRPRDIVKLGAVYAAGGRWNGRQIIPEQWVQYSTQAKIKVTAETTGLSPEEFSNNYSESNQAYIWQIDSIVVSDKTYTSYTASGNGGQMLIVVPGLELAIGFTGGNYRMYGVWGRWRQQIVGDYLIPALTN